MAQGHHTSTHCHCGVDREGNDHCPECGCEEFEGMCGYDHAHAEAMRMTPEQVDRLFKLTPEQVAAVELDRLFKLRQEANNRATMAKIEARRAERERDRLDLLYNRQALWIRADELRKELARVENEAANITVKEET